MITFRQTLHKNLNMFVLKGNAIKPNILKLAKINVKKLEAI